MRRTPQPWFVVITLGWVVDRAPGVLGNLVSVCDSPALLCWDRLDATVQASLRDAGALRHRIPSDKSLGYYRMSLRDEGSGEHFRQRLDVRQLHRRRRPPVAPAGPRVKKPDPFECFTCLGPLALAVRPWGAPGHWLSPTL